MSAGLALGSLGCASFGGIRTKADAMKFALEATVKFTDCEKAYQYDKAKELFDFFCEHVSLVDTDVVPLAELMNSFFEKLKEYIEFVRSEKKKE